MFSKMFHSKLLNYQRVLWGCISVSKWSITHIQSNITGDISTHVYIYIYSWPAQLPHQPKVLTACLYKATMEAIPQKGTVNKQSTLLKTGLFCNMFIYICVCVFIYTHIYICTMFDTVIRNPTIRVRAILR